MAGSDDMFAGLELLSFTSEKRTVVQLFQDTFQHRGSGWTKTLQSEWEKIIELSSGELEQVKTQFCARNFETLFT